MPHRAQFIFGHRNFRIRKRRSANRPKMVKLHNQSLSGVHAIKIRNPLKRPPFTFLRPLPITRVQ